MHTAENKITVFQNTLESLQKAPILYCRSKIEFRERMEGPHPSSEVSQWPSNQKIPRSQEHISS